MGLVRKVLRALLLIALVGLVLVGVVALITFLSGEPASSALVLLAIFAGALVLGVLTKPFAPKVKNGTILELDLLTAPVESNTSRVPSLKPSKLTLGEIVETLERAGRDKRVAGLIVRPRLDSAPLAVVDELRAAIVAFGETGKFTVATSDSYGEIPGNAAYLLASACKEVAVQESGAVSLSHLKMEMNFYPDTLARFGIDIEVFGRGKYKSAPNKFTLKRFSAADKEQRLRLLEGFWSHIAQLIGESRGLSLDEVSALAAKAPLQAGDALAAGLIDRIAYPDQEIAAAKERVGKNAKLLYLHVYKKRAGKARTPGKAVEVAVIRAVGEIQRDPSVPFGLGGPGPVISPDSLVPHIRKAVKDKNVKAIVLRIDSPGGSALASDSIWRELARVREAGKPLVASMGSVAASGGYYMAAPADRIVALPSTVTGSIGVFGMRPIVGGVKKKLDVHTDELYTGPEYPGLSLNRPAGRREKQKIEAQLDATYELFLNRVAQGRNMSVDDVAEVAQGRVWTGGDAVEAGLVDELGGLDHAVAVAVGLTDAKPGTRAKVKPFPKKASGLSMLKRNKGDNSEDAAAAAASLRLTPDVVARFGGVFAHLGSDPRSFWIR